MSHVWCLSSQIENNIMNMYVCQCVPCVGLYGQFLFSVLGVNWAVKSSEKFRVKLIKTSRGKYLTHFLQDDPEWFWVQRPDGPEGFVPAGFIYPLDAIQKQRKFDILKDERREINPFLPLRTPQPPHEQSEPHQRELRPAASPSSLQQWWRLWPVVSLARQPRLQLSPLTPLLSPLLTSLLTSLPLLT